MLSAKLSWMTYSTMKALCMHQQKRSTGKNSRKSSRSGTGWSENTQGRNRSSHPTFPVTRQMKYCIMSQQGCLKKPVSTTQVHCNNVSQNGNTVTHQAVLFKSVGVPLQLHVLHSFCYDFSSCANLFLRWQLSEVHARVWAKSKPNSEFSFLYSAVLVFCTCRFISLQTPVSSRQSFFHVIDSSSILLNRGTPFMWQLHSYILILGTR